MKKLILGIVALITVSLASYGVYRYFTGSPQAYGTANINIGAVAVSGICKDAAEGHSRLVCLAKELKKTLGPELMAQLEQPYSLADAKKWSNFPPAGYRDRRGPTLDKFNNDQLTIIKAILKEAAGTAANEGYDEIEQILNADDFLHANITGSDGGFSSGNFHLAFLGTPAETGVWQLYFGGHHLAVGLTYKDGKIVGTTPSFRGVEPFETFKQNGRDNMPMAQEHAAFSAMLLSLTGEERNRAKLTTVFKDILVGPQKDGAFPTERSGIRVGDLSSEQQALVISSILTYVEDVADKDLPAIMERYKAELADTYLAFSGTAELTAINDYVRLDGPSVWIEISMQKAASWNGIHPHSVWRDKSSDYGGNR